MTMLRSVVATFCLLSVLCSENKRSKYWDRQGQGITDDDLIVGTDDDDIGNIQLVAPLEEGWGDGLHNIRPELKENLLKQGVLSLEEAGKIENERKTLDPEVVREEAVSVVQPRRKVVYQPVTVFRYIPYWRHLVSHQFAERHRHYFY